MTRCLLAVSPHLDDAVFSAGGILARCARRGWRVVVVTCFTGNVARPDGFALACQLDKGLAADVDYMALRRAEDRAACAAIGATPLHLPFLEAPHRGYGDAAALFAGRRADDATIEPLLTAALRQLIAEQAPALVLGPTGLGGHVDHLVVRAALDALLALRTGAVPDVGIAPAAGDVAVEDTARGKRPRYWLWQDWPYADRLPTVPKGSARQTEVRLEAIDRQALTAGCSAYSSQLGFQFGSAEHLVSRLATRSGERFLRVHATSPGQRDGGQPA